MDISAFYAYIRPKEYPLLYDNKAMEMKTITKMVFISLISLGSLKLQRPITAIIILCFSIGGLIAQPISNPYLLRSTISASGISENVTVKNEKYLIQQSVGQMSSIKTFKTKNYIVRQGFIQPSILAGMIDQNLELKMDLVVYPNPFTSQISIEFSDDIANEVQLFIYDQFGQLVHNENQYVEDKTITLFLPELARSLYILKIQFGQSQFVKQIIKK